MEQISPFKEKKLTARQKLVDEIFKPDDSGISEWKTRDELSSTKLQLSKNGNSRHGKFYNDCRYIWESKKEKNTVVALRTAGYDEMNNQQINKRSIRKDIKDHHYKIGCVVCGCKSGLVVDHKNDLYNDPRVLNEKTQLLSDFQCLCNHCNLQKRQVCKDTTRTNKRYKATNIMSLKIFGVDFIDGGDESFDINDIDALKGTYWYDPVAFMEFIFNKNQKKEKKKLKIKLKLVSEFTDIEVDEVEIEQVKEEGVEETKEEIHIDDVKPVLEEQPGEVGDQSGEVEEPMKIEPAKVEEKDESTTEQIDELNSLLSEIKI